MVKITASSHKKTVAIGQRSFPFRGFGKKRGIKKRFYTQRERITGSAALYMLILKYAFEQLITNLKTKCKQFVNKRAAPVGAAHMCRKEIILQCKRQCS
jgi:hypothetical protein